MARSRRIDWDKEHRRRDGEAADTIRETIAAAKRDSKALRRTPSAEEMFADVQALLHPKRD